MAPSSFCVELVGLLLGVRVVCSRAPWLCLQEKIANAEHQIEELHARIEEIRLGPQKDLDERRKWVFAGLPHCCRCTHPLLAGSAGCGKVLSKEIIQIAAET